MFHHVPIFSHDFPICPAFPAMNFHHVPISSSHLRVFVATPFAAADQASLQINSSATEFLVVCQWV
jgi:hypothetical protein